MENIGRGTIMEKHREYPLAYPPISKVLVKEEPGGRWENVIADSSPQSGDAGRASHPEFNSESSSDEDGEECRLVAYPPLPKRIIKEEMDHGASLPEFNSTSRSGLSYLFLMNLCLNSLFFKRILKNEFVVIFLDYLRAAIWLYFFKWFHVRLK